MKDDNGNRALEIAENAEFGKVRIIYHDLAYMFAGKDVAKALGYKRPENAVTQHCKGILKLGIPSAGGVQETRFITEGDVYRLIIRSTPKHISDIERGIVGPSFPIIAKMGKLFDTGVDYYLYDTVDYVSDRMITADISEALVNCDTNTRMYCRELIKRTVAYSELLTKGTGGKKP